MTTDQIVARIIALTPAQARKATHAMSTDELAAIDHELARRAVLLGRPGVVGKTHRVIRDTLAAR